MEPSTLAQLLMLLIVAFLLFRTQSGSTRRGWRHFRRDPSIFPVFTDERAQRKEAEWLRERARQIPAWLIGAVVLLIGALIWWLNR
jgi:hypothetical protein